MVIAIDGSDVVLPDTVSGLKWEKPEPDQYWEDCTQILAAVPVIDRRTNRSYVEFSVVTIRCDEGYFNLECNGEPWGWDYSDIALFVFLST